MVCGFWPQRVKNTTPVPPRSSHVVGTGRAPSRSQRPDLAKGEIEMRRLVVLTALPVCFFLFTMFNIAHTAGPDEAGGNARRGVSFVARSDFPTAQNPASMTIGDFNNDGLLD